MTRVCVCVSLPVRHRGSLHSAAVLGAAAVGGSAPEGFPPLPLSERVAAQGEPKS